MAIHIGLRRAGWRGLIVAGACFIVPSVLIVLVLAWLYVRLGSTPQVGLVPIAARCVRWCAAAAR